MCCEKRTQKRILYSIFAVVIVLFGGFLIFMLDLTVREIRDVDAMDCEKYPYVCGMKSIGAPNFPGCMTIVYRFSFECLYDGKNCSQLLFRSCDDCGLYQFACASFMAGSCAREGRYLCGYYEKITNATNDDTVCYPNTLKKSCPRKEKLTNYTIGAVFLGVSGLIWTCSVVYIIVSKGPKFFRGLYAYYQYRRNDREQILDEDL